MGINRETYDKVTWLYDLIRQRGRINRKMISAEWVKRFNSESGKLPSKKEVLTIIKILRNEFFVQLFCDEHHYYYIESGPNNNGTADVRQFMFFVKDISMKLQTYQSVKDRIIFEQVPSADHRLDTMLHAMDINHTLKFNYHKFQESILSTREIEPLYTLIYQRRWYVLGKILPGKEEKHAGKISVFALDRMDGVTPTQNKIDPKTLKEQDKRIFNEVYGAYCDFSVPARRIVIRAYGKEKYYQESLPLHSSFKVLYECEDYEDFELYLRPTNDFIMDLVRLDCRIKVLEPQWLANEIRDRFKAGYDLYTDQ